MNWITNVAGQRTSRYNSRFNFCSNTDFEIQVDYDITTLGGGSNGPFFKLGFTGANTLEVNWNSGFGLRYFARTSVSASSIGLATQTGTSGKLKLRY